MDLGKNSLRVMINSNSQPKFSTAQPTVTARLQLSRRSSRNGIAKTLITLGALASTMVGWGVIAAQEPVESVAAGNAPVDILYAPTAIVPPASSRQAAGAQTKPAVAQPVATIRPGASAAIPLPAAGPRTKPAVAQPAAPMVQQPQAPVFRPRAVTRTRSSK